MKRQRFLIEQIVAVLTQAAPAVPLSVSSGQAERMVDAVGLMEALGGSGSTDEMESGSASSGGRIERRYPGPASLRSGSTRNWDFTWSTTWMTTPLARRVLGE